MKKLKEWAFTRPTYDQEIWNRIDRAIDFYGDNKLTRTIGKLIDEPIDKLAEIKPTQWMIDNDFSRKD